MNKGKHLKSRATLVTWIVLEKSVERLFTKACSPRLHYRTFTELISGDAEVVPNFLVKLRWDTQQR